MTSRTSRAGRFALVTLLILSATSLASAGRWIHADAQAMAEPAFSPVWLNWFEVSQRPLIYRRVVDVPQEANRATLHLRTSGYVYLWVDGKLEYRWAPVKGDEKKNISAQPADRSRVHEFDLSSVLGPGRHVICVSAPPEGFVIDGGLYNITQRLASLETGDDWTVTKFRPTTIIEDQSIMTLEYDGEAVEGLCGPARKVAVEDGEAWTVCEDALAATYAKGFAAWLREGYAEADWRLMLLEEKGIYLNVTGRQAMGGWGGSARLPAAVRARIQAAADLRQTPTGSLDERIAAIEKADVASVEVLEAGVDELADAATALRRFVEATAKATLAAHEHDDTLAIILAADALGIPMTPVVSDDVVEGITGQLNHPLGRLNESRYDRLGWINHPELADSVVGNWGVRVNPVSGETSFKVEHRWLFSTDPQDRGIEEQRQTMGYNIEGQWGHIDAQQNWQNDERYKDYRGLAWYRQWLYIPSEWAGNAVELRVPGLLGEARIWWNDTEVSEHLKDGKLTVPASAVMYGTRNCVAIRLDADGGQIGPARYGCPALDGPAGKATPKVRTLATPLSPCAVLTPETDELWIHHAGMGELYAQTGQADATSLKHYVADRDGKLATSWMYLMLMPEHESDPARPILLTFEKNPVKVTCEQGVTKITLSEAGQRVVAVRPWAKANPADATESLDAAASRWAPLTRAIPISYVTLTKLVEKAGDYSGITVDSIPPGPKLQQTVVYHYLRIEDEWGTEARKVAPIPALLSLATDPASRARPDDAPSLKLWQDRWELAVPALNDIQILQDGGMAAAYKVLEDTDRISYSYRIEAWPKLVGFTSWMFGGADVGVMGNFRECEILASTGANIYRPQHNYSDEPVPGAWGGKPLQAKYKTRVDVIVAACNEAGLAYMNNIDQTLGPNHKQVRNDYDNFIPKVYAHYEKIAAQLHDKPFWAVQYDLINEPFDHKAVKYNPAMVELTRRVRALDNRHLLCIEPCQAWGAIQQLRLIEPTGDPLTLYSFHDYNFRLRKADDRWPNAKEDIRTIFKMWWPAFEFQMLHATPMHCGEYGGFRGPSNDTLAQRTLQNDFFKVFDQMGASSNYYPGRTGFGGRKTFESLYDGSIRLSNVARTFREYFRRGDFNMYWPEWPGNAAGN